MRPIAVGLALRRLVSKVSWLALRQLAAALLAPRQLGVGVPSGAEAAVHAARRFLGSCKGDTGALVKLDLANALNSIDRGILLRCIREHAPGIERYKRASYGLASPLVFKQHLIDCACGLGVVICSAPTLRPFRLLLSH